MDAVPNVIAGGRSTAPLPEGVWPTGSDGRVELKYCVPEPVAARVLTTARVFLLPDPLAAGPSQRVTSLYLDTAQLTFLRWNQERVGDRFKLRIRCYGDPPAPTLYAELKRKTGSIVRKNRAAFPADALDAVLDGTGLPGRACSERDGDSLHEFMRRRRLSGAAPRILVSSIREALRACDPDDVTAVTVDRGLRCQPIRRGDMVGDPHAWTLVPLPPCGDSSPALVELKVSGRAPKWTLRLIDQLAPWRVSFSKYVAAMSVCQCEQPPAAGERAFEIQPAVVCM